MKINFKRLYRLCDYMAQLPKSANEHFAMQDFFGHKGAGHSHSIPAAPKPADLYACGTTACALGWATTVPSFRRAGLKIHFNKPLFGGGVWYEVDGEDKVFGIDPDDLLWEKLFGANNKDKTPKAWAARVRKILQRLEKEAA